MKRIVALMLVLVLALAGCGGSSTSQQQTPAPAAAGKDIVVLYTNDAHCGVEDNLGYQGLVAIKNAMTAAGNAVLLVDNGDAIQGDAIGTLSKGEYLIDIMNEIGYDVATPGNHEFDYGMDQYLAMVEKSNFPWVSANFVNAEGKAVLPAYVIKEVEGKKIAFVGITTPKTLTSSTPAYFQNEAGEYIYGFMQDETGEKLYATVQAAVDAAKAEGADVVVAMAHLGIEYDCTPYTSSDVITNTTGIDVLLDGHSHSVIAGDIVKNKDGKDVILTSTGTKLANIGVLTIKADGTITTALANDSGIGDYIDGIQSQFEELLNSVVARSEVDLVIYDPNVTASDGSKIRLIRSTETNLGDLCADAYRTISGAEIAFVNGGGIRADIPAGDITYGDIIAVHPYGNEMCVVEATGQEILDALELGARNTPGESGGFQQVSGMTYEIDLNVPSSVQLDENGMFTGVSGEYRVKNVTVGGEPIDLAKTYTLASHNYMIKSAGDGFNMFQDNVLLQDSVMIDNQVLINYIVEKLDGVVGQQYADPYGEGRITIIEAK